MTSFDDAAAGAAPPAQAPNRNINVWYGGSFSGAGRGSLGRRPRPHTGRWGLPQGAEARAVYQLRQGIVEPVFGQIKQWRGFRQFLLRGWQAVQAEWEIICTTHNVLKLYRFGGEMST